MTYVTDETKTQFLGCTRLDMMPTMLVYHDVGFLA